jgi:16S rRNA processing protein RimM
MNSAPLGPPTPTSAADDVRIGRVVAAHGLDGGVKVDPASDHVEEWRHSLTRVRVAGRWMAVRGQRRARGAPVLLLEGVADRSVAERLIGEDVFRAAGDLPALPPGEYYWHDLVGLAVVRADGAEVGRVAAVVRAGGDLLEVKGSAGTALVPLARAWVDVELGAGRAVLRRDPDWVSDAH